MPGSAPQLPEPARLFEQAACGLLITDTNGLILKANATFCRWLGYTADALVGKRRVQDLFTIGGRVFHQTHLAPLLQMQGSVAEVQLDMRHADGHPIPMLYNTVRTRNGENTFDEMALFVATDRRKYEHELLLARKTAEANLQALGVARQQLQESRDVLGIAMRGAKMGVWSRDIATGAVWFSSELEALAGLEEGSFGGTIEHFYALIHPADLDAVKATVADALDNVSDCSAEFRLSNGNRGWTSMDARVRLGLDAEGKPATVYGIAIDISERERDAARLRELNAELARADRKKDEFLATLAHELRNPLAPLRNVLEILKLKGSDDAQMIWAREVFERQMQQMSHLVDDLMEVSRITQGRIELRREPTEVGAIMRTAVEASDTLVRAGQHKLLVTPPASPVLVDADPTRLTQILTNLLNNAAKYTPDGGYVWFEAFEESGEVFISVRDSGIGIASDNLANVFTMFAQLEPGLPRSQGGLGIGLALVKGLVALHGGSIVAESAGMGQGSKFTVRLPVMEGRATPAAPEPEPVIAAATGRRILVVDDNRDAADMLHMALGMLGHEVHCAYDGRTAIATGRSVLPEVAVLDIGLPDMDGYAVARQIRQEVWGKNMILIAATGWGQQTDRDEATAAGFDHHMVKPIDFQQLDAVLRTG